MSRRPPMAMPPPPPRPRPPTPRRALALAAMSAAALVVAARAGDRGAFSELCRRYRPRIHALALHLTGDAHDADDVAQDTFMRAYKKLGEFRAASEFYTWVYRIALNLSFNVQRQRGRRRLANLDDPRVALAVQVDSYGDPRRAAELRQLYRRLLRALDELPATLRSTVVLVALQGMSHDQAAQVLACPAGTIAWRIHEARRRLSAALIPPARAPGATTEDDSSLMRLVPALTN